MKFRRGQEESFAFELTPLIDVVFLLLIFFMVSTAFIEFDKKLDIKLPESMGAVLDRKVDDHLVEIDANGGIFFDGVDVTMSQLSDRLAEAGSVPGPKSILIKADKRIDYGRVVKVMGLSKAAGINEIGVAVK